jgi:hypothetical protein
MGTRFWEKLLEKSAQRTDVLGKANVRIMPKTITGAYVLGRAIVRKCAKTIMGTNAMLWERLL